MRTGCPTNYFASSSNISTRSKHLDGRGRRMYCIPSPTYPTKLMNYQILQTVIVLNQF